MIPGELPEKSCLCLGKILGKQVESECGGFRGRVDDRLNGDRCAAEGVTIEGQGDFDWCNFVGWHARRDIVRDRGQSEDRY